MKYDDSDILLLELDSVTKWGQRCAYAALKLFTIINIVAIFARTQGCSRKITFRDSQYL